MFPKYEYRNHPIYAASHKHQGNYPARFHKHLEIMAVISTQVKVTIDGTAYLLEPGDLYVAFPNVLHAIEADNAKALVVLVDFEKYQTFHDLLLHNRPKNPVLRKGAFSESVYRIMERMTELASGDSPYRQETLAGYANALLGELLEYLQLTERSMDGTLVQQLQFYILKNYTRQITLEDVAQELGYSKYYISRLISNLFGSNFRTLINSYRISLAQNLLLTGNQSVGGIAKACGFKSQSAFNRTFIKQTGRTPNEYRRGTEQPPDKPVMYLKD